MSDDERRERNTVKDLKRQKDRGDIFEDDLEEIPYYMRDRVAYLINQKVEKRVQAHMAQFREEVMRELEDQRLQNQSHIAHYMQPQHYAKGHPWYGRPYGGPYGYNNGYYGGYGHPGYGYGYPGYPRTAQSKSPVRSKRFDTVGGPL